MDVNAAGINIIDTCLVIQYNEKIEVPLHREQMLPVPERDGAVCL